MNAISPTADAPLVYRRPWMKGRAVSAVFVLGLGVGLHFAERQKGGPGAGIGTGLILAVLVALTSWAMLGLRTCIFFTETGVTDVGSLRTVRLAWNEITRCTVVEQTLRPPKGSPTQGILIRFVGARTHSATIVTQDPPNERAIELFVPDALPLSPAIVALLSTIPQLGNAPWSLLESRLRR